MDRHEAEYQRNPGEPLAESRHKTRAPNAVGVYMCPSLGATPYKASRTGAYKFEGGKPTTGAGEHLAMDLAIQIVLSTAAWTCQTHCHGLGICVTLDWAHGMDLQNRCHGLGILVTLDWALGMDLPN